MAMIEDHVNERSILYTLRYIPKVGDDCLGLTEIVAYEYDNNPNSTPTEYVLTSIESGDLLGQGEIQISPDGNNLVYYNRKNTISGFAHRTVEINTFELTGDKIGIVNNQFITRNYQADPSADYSSQYGTYGKAALDFTTDNSIYFGQRGIFEEHSTDPTNPDILPGQNGKEKQVHYFNSTDGLISFTMDPSKYQYKTVRRGKDLLYYVPNEDISLTINELNSLTQGAPVPQADNLALLTNYSLLSSLPSQPYKIMESQSQPPAIYRLVGTKHYEFKDHLGNVRAVVSDRRGVTAINNTGTTANPVYTIDNDPELISWTDYYPYGAPLPNRSFSSNAYRYGFNGMEKDNEISGEGNSYTTMFRAYDSRIGRWKSIDPVIHHWQSSYSSFNNNPIFYTDPTGEFGIPGAAGVVEPIINVVTSDVLRRQLAMQALE